MCTNSQHHVCKQKVNKLCLGAEYSIYFSIFRTGVFRMYRRHDLHYPHDELRAVCVSDAYTT